MGGSDPITFPAGSGGFATTIYHKKHASSFQTITSSATGIPGGTLVAWTGGGNNNMAAGRFAINGASTIFTITDLETIPTIWLVGATIRFSPTGAGGADGTLHAMIQDAGGGTIGGSSITVDAGATSSNSWFLCPVAHFTSDNISGAGSGFQFAVAQDTGINYSVGGALSNMWAMFLGFYQ